MGKNRENWPNRKNECNRFGMDPSFPSAINPNDSVSWLAKDKHIGDYKPKLLQSTAEAHDNIRIKRINDNIQIKRQKA